MKRFRWVAKMSRKGRARVKLTDRSGRTVAKGKGKSVTQAQQDAQQNAKNEDARLYLRQVLVPNKSTKTKKTKTKRKRATGKRRSR
jgi:hypothetical protein